MKKLLGLVAVALMLSFATVSVGWAGPAQNHDQKNHQGKGHPQKTTRQPTGIKHHKPAGKESVKAPPSHRSQFKHNKPHTPAKIGAHNPPSHNRGQVKHNPRPGKISRDRLGPAGNHDRHQVKRHEQSHERSHSVHRNLPAHRDHSWHRDWPNNGNWRHHFRDWSWFSSHRVHNLGTRYADDRHNRALYFHFEPEDDNYLNLLESRYGHCSYRERHHRHGHDGWCHYWFRGDNVIALFIGDNGYSQAFVWQRDEAESQALALGILTPDLRIVYSSYDADMPPDLAAGYTQEVLWATVDDEL